MVRSSGKWTMYLMSLQGHGTSLTPGGRGIPTECRAGTKSASVRSMASMTSVPIRVMIFMEIAT